MSNKIPNLKDFNFRADQHRFRQGDLCLVLDVLSGSIHAVDQVVWDLLEALEEQNGDLELALTYLLENQADRGYSAADLQEAADEIVDLISEGTLFNQDPWRNNGITDSFGKAVVKSLCLNVAHDCNLSCEYCFASRGNFGGSSKLMPFEIGKAALDFLVEHSENRQHCEVDFFGGEPLLNFAVVKQIVEYGRQIEIVYGKKIQFTLTTNAVLLEAEIQDYLNQNNISMVLSLDGRPEVHDRMRVFPDGSGSYAEVRPRIQAMAESRQHQNYYVRGTYTKSNLDFAQDVLHLADQGFQQVSVEPVVAPETEDYALGAEDLPQIFAEYDRLASALEQREEEGRQFNFFHFDLNLEHGPCLPKRLKGCGAGNEYLAITPEGDIYPCHQFVGRPEYRMGNLLEKNKIKWETMDEFRNAHIYGKSACSGCWTRFYCGGGCHANAQAFNGTIYQPYWLGCEIQKKRLEVAVYMQAKRLIKAVDAKKNK